MGHVKLRFEFTVAWMDTAHRFYFHHSRGFYEESLSVWRLHFRFVWRSGMRDNLREYRGTPKHERKPL